jgi:hypothetical protein
VARVPRDEAMTFTSEVRLSRSRRSLVVVAVAILVVSASAFWLAESGTLSLPQAPTPNGAGGSGVLSTVTVPLGQGAQVATGELLGKVTVAAGYAPRIQIDISWLNPQDAGAVLNNPNGWMTFGLYYPIHTGTCTGGDASGSQSITVGVAALCVAPNTQASGPVTYNGALTINATQLSGFILETFADPVSRLTCGPTGSTWCAPAGTASDQNIFYISASVNTPGGTPPAQQSLLTTLSFYIGARSF